MVPMSVTNSLPRPVNFTRDDVNAAANAAQQQISDPHWRKAIERALTNLGRGHFSFDGQQVILKSATSDQVYRINVKEPMQCSCKGRARGYKCWHIVAARLLVRAAERYATRQQPAPMLPVLPRRQYSQADFDACYA